MLAASWISFIHLSIVTSVILDISKPTNIDAKWFIYFFLFFIFLAGKGNMNSFRANPSGCSLCWCQCNEKLTTLKCFGSSWQEIWSRLQATMSILCWTIPQLLGLPNYHSKKALANCRGLFFHTVESVLLQTLMSSFHWIKCAALWIPSFSPF